MANPVAIVRTGRHAGRHVRRHAERHVGRIVVAGLTKDRSHGYHKRHRDVGAVTRPVSRRAARMAITNKRRRAARRRSHSRGATQDELAALAGVSRHTVVKIEGGLEPRPPTIRKLAKARKLAQALGGEPKNLMAPEEPRREHPTNRPEWR